MVENPNLCAKMVVTHKNLGFGRPLEMSEEKKEVIVQIDSDIYSAVEEYCEYTGISEENIVNYLVSHSLNEFSSNYYHLKKGYVDMGNINLEISAEFTESENEALSHIED